MVPAPLKAWSPAPRRKFTPIRRGTGTFEGRGGTIGWLVRDEALVVVDSQFPESAQTCLEGLEERSTRRIDLLINSHHHGDHTAGNPILGADAGHILAHSNALQLQRASAQASGRMDEQKFPDATFEEEWEEQLGDETIRLYYHGPAHTSGDAVIHFEKADVVHMGDLVFNRRPPFIDLGAGASTENWILLLHTVHSKFSDQTIFIFGHANPTYGITGTREDLLIMGDFLEGIRNHVAAGIRSGKTADELAEETGALPDFEEFGSEGIERCLRTVYQEMSSGDS